MASTSSSDAFSISKSAVRSIVLAVVAIVVLALIVFGVVAAARSLSPGSGLPSQVGSSTYQAVFLANGQVFFGKLSSGNSSFYELRHVYFLQSSITSKGQPGAQRLIKLTREIHGPQDLMMISRSQVLYIENLDPAGQAAKVITSSGG